MRGAAEGVSGYQLAGVTVFGDVDGVTFWGDGVSCEGRWV